jgi:hypothetical protein
LFWIEFCFWFHCEEKAKDLGMVAADDAQQEAIGSDLSRLNKKVVARPQILKIVTRGF